MDSLTHYVIVVHGTFAAPVETERQWHQLDETDPSNFCKLLNDRLEAAGLSRPIERTFDGVPIHFSWSGANDHSARIAAAEELYRLVTRLVAKDRTARVHFIAHSHGGNVVLKALELYLTDIINAACGWYWGLTIEMELERRLQLDEAMKRLNTRKLQWAPALDALLADTAINQIGRVVFLGTPFYGKNWRTPDWNAWRVLLRLAWNAMSAVVLLYAGLVVLFGGLLLVRGMDAMRHLVSSASPRTTASVNLNVLSWTTGSLIGFSTAALILAVLAVRSERKRHRRNIPNVYFDEAHLAELLMDSSKRQATTPPFASLVVSMDLLDEALLGLSIEPIVYGLLAPRIRALFQPRESITQDAMGLDLADLSGVMSEGTRWLASKIWRFTAAVRRSVAWATSPLHRPVVNLLVGAAESFLLRIISSAAFGVPPQEFSDSSIVVKKGIDVPVYFAEVSRDVSPSFQSAYASDRLVESPGLDRYAFLDDDVLLETLASRSALCGELEKAQRQLVARYHDYPDGGSGLLSRLRRISVTLEHRLGDLVTGFGHVRYYSMPHLIDMIAKFIATGQAPGASDAESRPLGH